jgi:hypothetical protein
MSLKPLVLLLASVPLASPQGNSLPAKETLYYSIEWRLFTAGRARLDWNPAARAGWQVNLHVESAGFVSKLYRVEDTYSAYLNQALCAQSVQLEAHEGSRQRETKITFDPETRKASYLERDQLKNAVILSDETAIPQCVHDVVGGLFFLRTLTLEPGQSLEVPVSDGKKSAMVKVEAQQREDVKTPEGLFKTIRYEIYVFNNVLYHRPAHLHVWLTDDRRRLPVQLRVRLQFTIGTINLQLVKHE